MTALSVFLLGRSDRKSGGATSQWRGAASQNGTQSICKNIPWVKGEKREGYLPAVSPGEDTHLGMFS